MTEKTNDTTTKGHCPNCGPDRNAKIIARHITSWDDDEMSIWGKDRYFILQCGGCNRVYFRHDEQHSESWEVERDRQTGEERTVIPITKSYWPAPAKRKEPEWFYSIFFYDERLHELMTQTYNALSSDSRILAAIGLRTAFDRMSELLKIDPAESFNEKLDDLLAGGHIGESEKQHLDILTNAGSAAAHRGWSPNLEDLSLLMDIAEAFMYRTFILDFRAKKLAGKIPPKPQRQKK